MEHLQHAQGLAREGHVNGETVGYSERDGVVTWVVFDAIEKRQAALLLWYRVAVCDLLHGRSFRAHAKQRLQDALDFEAGGAPRQLVTEELDVAAHMEWVALITECGQVRWGRRQNRVGESVEYMHDEG